MANSDTTIYFNITNFGLLMLFLLYAACVGDPPGESSNECVDNPHLSDDRDDPPIGPTDECLANRTFFIDRKGHTRIEGGCIAGSAPHQTILRSNGQFICGGSIISERAILTAAHCVFAREIKDFTVVVGTKCLSVGGIEYKLKSIFVNNLYTPPNYSADLAILFIDGKLKFSDTVQAIPMDLTYIPSGITANFTGWGRESAGGMIPENLQIIELNTIDNEECVAKWPVPEFPVEACNLCTLMNRGSGVCEGDSGSPLVLNGKQIGVMSRAYPCARAFPDLFIRISCYAAWIVKTVRNYIYQDRIEGPDRVLGGLPAQPGQFPYMVSLQGDNHLCGGSILSKRTILTAGHCLWAPASSYSVLVGTNYLSTGGRRYEVDDYIVHPDYSSDLDTATNDIAVVYLKKDLKFSSLVSPIQLDGSYIGGALDVVFSGWGFTAYPGATSNVLEYLDLETIDEEQCQSKFHNMYTVDESQICTFNQAGQGICFGDSGSPLVLNGKQIGIASWVEPCAIGYPDVYTRISSFVEWIESVTI